MWHCGHQGVNGLPTPIYQPASPKQTDRQGSCPNRPVYLATAAQRTGQWLFTLLPSPNRVTHWQGISMQSLLGDESSTPVRPTTPEQKVPERLSLRRGMSLLRALGWGGGLRELVTEMANQSSWATVTMSSGGCCTTPTLPRAEIEWHGAWGPGETWDVVKLGCLEYRHLESLLGNMSAQGRRGTFRDS